MSLLLPTPGEMVDRWLIVLLKCKYGRQHGLDVTHFDAERADIVLRLAKEGVLSRIIGADESGVKENVAALAAVHEKSWELVDEMERWAQPRAAFGHGDTVAECALALHRLNRERVRLREEIDKALGCYRGPEKL